jgi:putative glutamine amidotransferase
MPIRPSEHVPRIGLTTYRERAAWGVWDLPADLLPAMYAEGIQQAGGAAVLLPPGPADTVLAVLAGVHGLLISGGADVDPTRYGAAREEATQAPRPDRDAWELALVTGALAIDLPVLAVCRGMQVLNVALGGDLVQDLPGAIGSDAHCPAVGVHGRHVVAIAAGSRLAAFLGERAEVATHHHQAVGRLGTDLIATAWADDGVVEAVELAERSWVLGVQWHPEAFDGAALFGAFLDACRIRRDVLAEARG